MGERIASVLRGAGLTARDLSAATLIHYSTIYNMIREGNAYVYTPRTEDALHKTLRKIETLHAEGKLPMLGRTSARERSERLLSLLAAISN